MSKPHVLKRINRPTFKITVEEVSGFHFIATYWDKSDCLEVDREVQRFETYGGAVDAALDLLDEATGGGK